MNLLAEDKFLVALIQEGGLAVIPTDTLYGVVTNAMRKESVERLYQVRERGADKPFIVLLAEPEQVYQLDLMVPLWGEALFQRTWPGPVSFVLTAGPDTPEHLHRGGGTVAVRVPASEDVRAFIKKTGPLVAPSANPPGMPPATTAYWAKQYFGDQVDYYVDGGYKDGKPSTVARIDGDDFSIVREGAFDSQELLRLAGK